MMNTATTKLGYQTKSQKRNWMTDEILSLMEERRKSKCQADQNKYKNIQKIIKTKIRIAKNAWLNQECEETEKLQSMHDDLNLHKRLKQTAGVYRKKIYSTLVNENNEIATNTQEKKSIWEKYISELFLDDRQTSE